MDLGISSRSALVAASTSGLGRAIATALADEGVRVVINGRHNVEEVVAEIRERGGDAVGIAADLTEPGAIEELVKRARAAVGDIDILVLNGGGPPPAPAYAVDDDGVSAAIDSLLRPHVELIRRLLPGMRERRWGRILAVGSSGIQAPLPDLALSNLGRGALAGYLKTLAAEVAPDGVTVNLLLPGRIDTERVKSLDAASAERQGRDAEQVRADVISTIPAGRYGDPSEFGAAGAFLCSGPAAYITGTALRVDGGAVQSL
ncbi:3-oxoacyl-[acyl-carrier protein] reductase [Bowdeniella nasicola]|uniref:3-oxoacyl-[acyl-carrier protein] reductase n=1 Tax=Bowdeniella nasicola TaxID=208480 RepID=A0A1H3Y0W5_9ACTO|nr:SDR family oxidoreductase [Bowdeniella nasicola]SEA04504.1 3-oxoacyl-[acyl-carrier protein] reductase [Bowdeniella nasicola]